VSTGWEAVGPVPRTVEPAHTCTHALAPAHPRMRVHTRARTHAHPRMRVHTTAAAQLPQLQGGTFANTMFVAATFICTVAFQAK
jgi:hypothetical protein